MASSSSASSSSSESDEPTLGVAHKPTEHHQTHAPPTQAELQSPTSQLQQSHSDRRLRKLRSAFRRDTQTSIVDPGQQILEASKWEALATKHQQLASIHSRHQHLFKDFTKLTHAMSKVSELLASISARAGALREVTNAAYPGLYPLLSATESFFLSVARRQQELEFTLSQASAPLNTSHTELHSVERALKRRDGRLGHHSATMRKIELTQVTTLLEHLPRAIQSVQAFNEDLATTHKQSTNLIACCDASCRALGLLQTGGTTPGSFHLFPNLRKASLRPTGPQPVVQLSSSKHHQASRRLQSETVAILAPASPFSASLSVSYSRASSSVSSAPFESSLDPKTPVPRYSLQTAVELHSSANTPLFLSQSQPGPPTPIPRRQAQSPPLPSIAQSPPLPSIAHPQPQSPSLELHSDQLKSPPSPTTADQAAPPPSPLGNTDDRAISPTATLTTTPNPISTVNATATAIATATATVNATTTPFLLSTREFPPAPPPPSDLPSSISPPIRRSTSPDSNTVGGFPSQSSTTIPISASSSSSSAGGPSSSSSFSSSAVSSYSIFSLSLSSPSPPSPLSPHGPSTSTSTSPERLEPALSSSELLPSVSIDAFDSSPPTGSSVQQPVFRMPTPTPIATEMPRHRIVEVKPSASAFPLEPFLEACSSDGILYSSDEFGEDQDEFSDNPKNDSDDESELANDSSPRAELTEDSTRPSPTFPGRPKGFLEFSKELDRPTSLSSPQHHHQQSSVPVAAPPPISSNSKSFSFGRLTKSLLTGESSSPASAGEPSRQMSSSPPSSGATLTAQASPISVTPTGSGSQRILSIFPKPEPAVSNDDIATVVNLPDEKDLKFSSRDGQLYVRAGSFERLVERLTHPSLSDPTFRKAFLHTSPLFAGSADLLSALINRFELTVQQSDRSLHLIRLRVLGALQAWFGLAGYVLEDEVLVQRLQEFLTTLGESPHLSSSFLPQALQIRHLIARKIEKRQAQQRRQRSLKKAIKNATRQSFGLLSAELDVVEAAETLTLIESEFYCNISSIELLFYVKSNNKDVDSPNIFALIDLFNRFSSWLSSEIVTLPRIQDRVRAIEKAITLGSALFSLNNLNGTVGVISALANSSVRRLKESWKLVSPELRAKLAELEEIFSPDFAYRAFRDYLRNSAPPCIPYLGIFLTDMTFILEGNPSFVDTEKLINFSKYFKVFQLLQQLQNYQEPYVELQKRFRRGNQLSPIEQCLRTLPRVEESFLYERSTLIEPKDWEDATEKWLQMEARLLERIRLLESKTEASPRLSAP